MPTNKLEYNRLYREKHKEQFKEYMRVYHKTNRIKIYARRAINRSRNQAYINNLKSAPCMDCGRCFNPWVMDFDHRNPAEKEFSIAHAVEGGYTLERIKREVAKCDLVCANCHRERTYKIGYGFLRRLRHAI